MNIVKRDDQSFFNISKYVTELKPTDFDSNKTWFLKKHKCSLVLFYAPWCPYCKDIKDLWNDLGKKAVFSDVCAMNCQKYSRHIDNIKQDMPELISGYPTMIVYSNGNPVEKIGVSGEERNLNNLIKAAMRACKNKA